MLGLSFKETKSEFMVRIAATLIFDKLVQLGYPIVPLKELTENPQYGFTASATLEDTGVKFVRITDLKDGKINWDSVPYCQCEKPEQYLLERNDILFARTGATTGKTHLVLDTPCAVFASYLIRVRPKNLIQPEYLYSFFQSNQYWEQILDEKQGSAQPNVNGQKLLTIQLPFVDNRTLQLEINDFLQSVRLRQYGHSVELSGLSYPLEEQQRIVAYIEELAARIELARGLRQGAIEEARKLKLQIYDQLWYECEKLGEFELLGTIANVIDPQPDHRTPPEMIGGLPYVSIANIRLDGSVDILNARKVPISAIEKQEAAFTLKTGDVVLGKIGTVGAARPLIVKERFALSANIVLVQPNREKILDGLLLGLLRSPQVAEQFVKDTRNTAQGAFGIKKMRNLFVPVPSFHNQIELLTWHDELQKQVEHLYNLQSAICVELDALLPSILDKAFRGEL